MKAKKKRKWRKSENSCKAVLAINDFTNVEVFRQEDPGFHVGTWYVFEVVIDLDGYGVTYRIDCEFEFATLKKTKDCVEDHVEQINEAAQKVLESVRELHIITNKIAEDQW